MPSTLKCRTSDQKHHVDTDGRTISIPVFQGSITISPIRQEWSNDEDLSLLELILKFGKRWRYIQQEWKLPTKRTLRQMSNRLVMLLENEKKFFTPLHCIPRSRREIKPVQDSGYDSDTSSCSSSADT